MKPVRIGSRGSMLATWQAKHIAEQFAEMGVPTEIVFIKTSGDRFQQAGVNQIGVKGVFIKELEDALLDGRVDIAVHSMKDVPTETPEGLTIAAICEREDPRDCLVARAAKNFVDLPRGARIGTGSLRRQAQLRHARPDITFVELRGNVDTRLQKLDRGEYDAIVLAKAGLDRLGLSGRITKVFSPEMCLPAVGQGALGIETRTEFAPEIAEALRKFDHFATRVGVTAERALLRKLEGGCQVPLGAWGQYQKNELLLEACIVSADGREYIRKRASGKAEEAESLGRGLGWEMIAAGAGKILQLVGRTVAGQSGN
ncbi:MAG TPA: hydroxymethylbilane synthase [Candidatus Limnocylindrales bacterium]|nr:hydroxymethylbilane synthase [Candidatus Limnocylindrales bacterium]